MLGLRPDGDGPPLVLLLRADTVDLARTVAAICCGEFDLDDLIGPVVDSGSPIDTLLSFRTDCLLMFPIDEELAGINALLRCSLATSHRHEQDQ